MDISSKNFDQDVLKADGTVLVYYHADWCGPCRQLGPILESIESEHAGVHLAKVNADDEGELCLQYKITSIPTVLVFRGGELVKQFTGARPKPQIEADLEEWL